ERVSRSLAGIVRVEVLGGGQRDALEHHLRDKLGGTLKPIVERLQGTNNLSVRELGETIEAGAEALRKRYGFTPAQAEHLTKLPEDSLLELQELELGPVTRIDLNVMPGSATPR